ncbi:MAG: Fe-S cluster assembly protein SufD, partial [Planctomycetota bacterium]
EHGLPTRKAEAWRYLDLRALSTLDFGVAEPKTLSAADLEPHLLGDASTIRMVFVDGVYSAEFSHLPNELPEGVRLGRLADALESEPALEQGLGSLIADSQHTFSALNTARFTDGFYLVLDKGAKLCPFVQVLFVATEQQQPQLTLPRLFVSLAPNSQAKLIESYAGIGNGSYLQNVVTEIKLAEGASLRHIKVQRESLSGYHVARMQSALDRSSHLDSLNIQLGGLLARNDLDASLDGEGIECRLDGVTAATGDAVIDNHTTLDHRMPHCNSYQVYKTILGGRARGVFNGKIFVQLDAQKTDAKQSNHSLLLSNTAEVDTKPQLEIFADDVKCTHGATVGQLPEEALFYLRARGLSETHARRVLTYGFAAELVDSIADDTIRGQLRELLLAELMQIIDREQEA